MTPWSVLFGAMPFSTPQWKRLRLLHLYRFYNSLDFPAAVLSIDLPSSNVCRLERPQYPLLTPCPGVMPSQLTSEAAKWDKQNVSDAYEVVIESPDFVQVIDQSQSHARPESVYWKSLI